jgi:transposase
MNQELFQLALNINDPWFVSDLQFDVKSKRLDIEIGRETFSYLKSYDTMNKSWKHLNFFEHECYINARVPRVKLPNGKTRLIKTPWEGLSNGFTLLFEALLVQLCR